MRHVSLVACLLCVAAATVAAAPPWGRIFSRAPRQAAAESSWAEEREIGPYLIRSEFALRDVQDLVHDLGDLQADLERALKLKCQPQEIQIHLFNSKRSYDQYLSIRVPEGVKRQALYVPDKDHNVGRVYAYHHRDLDTDVRHETTHALLHTALPYVPIWIDEGFAEYFEVPAAMRVKGHSHRGELRSAISRRFQPWKPNIEGLEAKEKFLEMGKDDYRDSWGIVHFLLNGPVEARESLTAYLDEIQSGDVLTPISQHLRRRIANLDQAIIDHLMK